MKVRHQAILEVTSAQLCQALHLPPDTYIVRCGYGEYSGTVSFCIEHPDLKPVVHGYAIPTVRPRITRFPAAPEQIVFEDWGQ